MSNLYIHPLYSNYACDNESNVYSKQRSSRNKTGEFMKLKLTTIKGYLFFNICFEDKRICKRVHSFVFECYTNQTYQYSNKTGEGLTINHINGNKLNNRFDNLELVTHRKNVQLQERYKKENKLSGLPRFVALNKTSLERGYPNPYCVRIQYEGKLKYFGRFPSPELASSAAKTKFQELYPKENY